MIPKQFTLGGMKYQVLTKDTPGYRWRNFIAIQEIHLTPEYMGEKLREDVIEKHFWEAVTCLVVERVMLRDTPIWTENRQAVGNLVAQIMAPFSWNKNPERNVVDFLRGANSSMTIDIGGAKVNVYIDNTECDKRKCFGEYDGNSESIILQSEGVSEEVYMKYTSEFILRVLIHECLHAICAQLGLSKTKWNTEHNINTMAYFLTEVYLSLKSIKDGKEDNTI